MGLEQVQQVLAKLYTNTEFRERFFNQPGVVGAELGLSSIEIEQLSQLTAKDVTVFANSLKWKRLGELRELLPITAGVLGKEFNTLFWGYAESYLPTGIKKHRDDAIAFSNFILQTPEITPVWVKDLVIFEQAWLLTYQPNRCFLLRCFSYTVHQQDIKPQLTIALWWRLQKLSSLQHLFITFNHLWFKNLLLSFVTKAKINQTSREKQTG